MSEQFTEQPQLPLTGIGPRLKAAREEKGISRAEIAERTRIAERVIAHIEAGEFDRLPSRTYATGFTRSYARAVGLDEREMVEGVRRELGMAPPTESASANEYEPGDPGRVPSARFAWLLALGAVLLVGAGFAYWRYYYNPAMSLPPLTEPSLSEPAYTTEATASALAPDPALSAAPAAMPAAAAPAMRRPAAATERAVRPSPRPQRITDPAPTLSPLPAPTMAIPPPAQPAASPSTITN